MTSAESRRFEPKGWLRLHWHCFAALIRAPHRIVPVWDRSRRCLGARFRAGVRQLRPFTFLAVAAQTVAGGSREAFNRATSAERISW